MHSLKPVLKECLHAHFIQQLLTDVENKSCSDYFSYANLIWIRELLIKIIREK